MLRPYKVEPFGLRPHNGQHTVDVVRHDNKGLKFDLGKMNRDLQPGLLDDAPPGGKMHGAICDLTEEAALLVGANGDEVEAAL